MSKIKVVFITFVAILILFVLPLGLGLYGNLYNSIIGTGKANIDRNIQKNSKSYTEGTVNDLVRYKAEYDKSKDQKVKESIIDEVLITAGNFDTTRIENANLKRWVESILDGSIDLSE